ncbi:hypothetical protein ZWY2020_028551 [Hordeum vulgare]|nr:hypothetical protein ZWY2020_028551 [Hordeum vulgare]
MDSLIAEEVEWKPYGAGGSFGYAHTFLLNSICLVTRRSGWTRIHNFTGWIGGGSERSRIGISILGVGRIGLLLPAVGRSLS